MARSKSTLSSQSASNHKLTEFFQRKPTTGSVLNSSSSCAPSSPLPSSSQTSVSHSPLNHSQSKASPFDMAPARRWIHSNPQTEATRIQKTNSKNVQQGLPGVQEQPPAIRVVKKENAPPVASMPRKRDLDVISLSSSSDHPANSVISISSGSPAQKSVISISSGSIQSPPLVPISDAVNSANGPIRQLRRSQRQASVIDLSSSTPSPKAAATLARRPNIVKKTSASKRKRDYMVAIGDSEDTDEVIVITSPKRSTFASEIKSDPMITEECIVASRFSPWTNSPRNQSNPIEEKTPSSRKRAKHDASGSTSTGSQVIPSSQSDEEEICLPKASVGKDIIEVTENVIAWQRASQQSAGPSASPQWGYATDDHSSVPDIDFGTAMDVDTPALSPRPKTPTGQPSLESVALTSHSSYPSRDSTSEPHTPPPIQPVLPIASSSASSSTKVESLLPSLTSKDEIEFSESVLPVLTSNDKTAQLIADIKKKALLTVSLNDVEEKIYDDPLPVLDDSSDEDDDGVDGVFYGKKRSSSSASEDGSSSPLTDVDELSPIRKSTANKSSRKLRTPRKSGYASTRSLPKTVSGPSSSLSLKKKKVNDPFAALMRAKNASEKRKSADTDFKVDLDLTLSPCGEARSQIDNPPLSPLLTPLKFSGSQNKTMDLGQILGDDGEAIKRIVHDDHEEQAERRRKGKQKQKPEAVLGVKFWEEVSGTNLDNTSFVLPNVPKMDVRHPSYQLLCTFVASNDIDGVALLLDCSVFISEDFHLTSEFVLWLLKIVSSNELLAEKATSTILHLIDRGMLDAIRCKTRTPLRVFIEAMIQSGAKVDVLNRLEIVQCRVLCASPQNRHARVCRWVRLAHALASVNMFEERQVPNLIAVLLCIAMDPSSDIALQDSVKKTIETLCNAYCVQDKRNEIELSICRQSLLLWGSLDVVNKTHLISFIPGGSAVASRIAQWIAFGMLAGDTASDLAAESDEDLLPPLGEVHALITQRKGDVVSEDASSKFDLSRMSDEVEFDILAGNIELLSRVLSNVYQYVLLDGARRVETTSTLGEVKDVFASPSRNTASVDKTPLDKIEGALKTMAGRIKDSSSKPERSRAKATIQRLVHRLSYQRNLGSNPSREVSRPKAPKKIDAFFRKSD